MRVGKGRKFGAGGRVAVALLMMLASLPSARAASSVATNATTSAAAEFLG